MEIKYEKNMYEIVLFFITQMIKKGNNFYESSVIIVPANLNLNLLHGTQSCVYLNRFCAEYTRTRDIRVELLVLTSYFTRCRAVESLKWHLLSSKPRVARQIWCVVHSICFKM